MISVTVAAHGRTRRVVGAHLRAYGSGRLSICDLEKETLVGKKNIFTPKARIYLFINKLLELCLTVLRFCLPFLFSSALSKTFRTTSFPKKFTKSSVHKGPINKLNGHLLARIFLHLDAKSVRNCESVCGKWYQVVNSRIPLFQKTTIDQLRVLFDEGEVVIYPLDEKRCPTRHPMPSLQILARKLKHLKTQSLFVRGLIPVESAPVLRMINRLWLEPQQIYFIWSHFSLESLPLLHELMHMSKDTLTDLGLEECAPSTLFTDSLLAPAVQNLSSLRLWNNGKSTNYSVTDVTVFELAKSVKEGRKLETIDLATCPITNKSIITVVLSWVVKPSSDLSISLSHCNMINGNELLENLAKAGIFLENGQMRVGGYTLSIFF